MKESHEKYYGDAPEPSTEKYKMHHDYEKHQMKPTHRRETNSSNFVCSNVVSAPSSADEATFKSESDPGSNSSSPSVRPYHAVKQPAHCRPACNVDQSQPSKRSRLLSQSQSDDCMYNHSNMSVAGGPSFSPSHASGYYGYSGHNPREECRQPSHNEPRRMYSGYDNNRSSQNKINYPSLQHINSSSSHQQKKTCVVCGSAHNQLFPVTPPSKNGNTSGVGITDGGASHSYNPTEQASPLQQQLSQSLGNKNSPPLPPATILCCYNCKKHFEPRKNCRPKNTTKKSYYTEALPKSLSYRKICSKCGKTRIEHGKLGFGNKCIYQECGRCRAGVQMHVKANVPMGFLCTLSVKEGAMPGAAELYERKINDLAMEADSKK